MFSKNRLSINGKLTAVITKNSGFPVYVYCTNQQGEVYYFRHLKEGVKTLKINFAKGGIYEFNTSFDSVEKKPLEIMDFNGSLPAIERNRERAVRMVKNLELKGTPARIYSQLGIIETGDRFEGLPIPCKVFILLHEYGHFFYKTEYKTDLFALYWFNKLGYNLSNAQYTLINILTKKTPESEHRIKNLFQTIFKNYK